MNIWKHAFYILALSLTGCAQTADTEPKTSVVLGGGGTQGTYYAAVGEICKVVNARQSDHGFRCSAVATKGSVSNLRALRSGSGDLDLAMALSDWQFNAFNGVSRFDDAAPARNLRSVFALWPETFTIFAKRNAGISSIADLKGKRVNIGRSGSGTRHYWNKISAAHGWSAGDFALNTELRAPDAKSAFCRGEIDVYFMIVGHPSALTQETLSDCGAIIVAGTGPAVDELVSASTIYRKATIPIGTYSAQDEPVQTFALGPVLTATAETPADVVYWIVKSVFDDFEDFKSRHPAFAYLTKREMVRGGLTAPLHPGAIKYYREAGLI
ncbi:MAG: TAXI family TRAP transporter solute-binding subunit [Pseudomonadota bacterium]